MGWRSRGRAEMRGLSASGSWDAGSQNEVGRQAPSSCPDGQCTFLLLQAWASPWVWDWSPEHIWGNEFSSRNRLKIQIICERRCSFLFLVFIFCFCMFSKHLLCNMYFKIETSPISRKIVLCYLYLKILQQELCMNQYL